MSHRRCHQPHFSPSNSFEAPPLVLSQPRDPPFPPSSTTRRVATYVCRSPFFLPAILGLPNTCTKGNGKRDQRVRMYEGGMMMGLDIKAGYLG
ncbi:hypothetical protein Acr_00g0008950 [Actinidia rufa]|uniref:Uncharacterized protein n=1 Tax=Actinidia rufa TaxID=165716 RepID=A0A7J0DAF8_9ERIC|nr:hypothetical protein Acr_00g0008950 [Actinidia rufa]